MSDLHDGNFIFPASFGQQRLWFLAQLAGDAGQAYNMVSCFEADGALDLITLQQAINVLVDRHEILRTTFTVIDEEELEIGDQLCQVVAPEADVTIEQLDLHDIPADRHMTFLADWAGRAFDLDCGPLLRVGVARLGQDRHLLVLAMHHIISDGWSMSVLSRELGVAYKAIAEGNNPSLTELPIQYADFTAWQRELLRGPRHEHQLDYWRYTLGGIRALDLPLDHPRPPYPTYRGSRVPITVPQDVVAGLEQVGRDEQATLFMAVQAAFMAVLGQRAGQHDFGIGVPVAGRRHPDLQELIGFFVNTVVMRADLSGDPTFRQLMSRIRVAALNAFEYQDVPFEQLVQELVPDREPNRSPLFQVMFSFQDTPQFTAELPGLRLIQRELPGQTAMFDLRLNLTPTATGLTGWFEFNRDLFTRDTVALLRDDLVNLLRVVISNPDHRIRIEDRGVLHGTRRPAGLASGENNRTLLAPRTALERHITQAFRKFLHLDQIDIRDSFFALGGNSLLAARLIADLRKSLGTEVPTEIIFNLTSVEQLAADLESPEGSRNYPDAQCLTDELVALMEQESKIVPGEKPLPLGMTW